MNYLVSLLSGARPSAETTAPSTASHTRRMCTTQPTSGARLKGKRNGEAEKQIEWRTIKSEIWRASRYITSRDSILFLLSCYVCVHLCARSSYIIKTENKRIEEMARMIGVSLDMGRPQPTQEWHVHYYSRVPALRINASLRRLSSPFGRRLSRVSYIECGW